MLCIYTLCYYFQFASVFLLVLLFLLTWTSALSSSRSSSWAPQTTVKENRKVAAAAVNLIQQVHPFRAASMRS